jgi:WD40-like Beta Propeller Repeat
MMSNRFSAGPAAVLVAAALALAACGARQKADAVAALPEYRAFGEPQLVAIRGYQGDAMEPFITKDGRYLLFNNRNDPKIDTRLLFAERVDDLTFDYRGELEGANTSALEGVPSMDRHGNLFFVSTRSYAETLSTIYRGRFGQGKVSGIELVAGISLRQRGMVTFDAEVSADGSTLFVADGRFAGGHVPETADIDIAVRDGAGFRRLPGARDLLRNVNTAALEYAPAVSGDLLELFFTRLEGSARSPRTAILRAVRPDAGAPFGAPQRLASITGFVEAPALSGDGRSLYYHRLDGGRFVILRVARSIRP